MDAERRLEVVAVVAVHRPDQADGGDAPGELPRIASSASRRPTIAGMSMEPPRSERRKWRRFGSVMILVHKHKRVAAHQHPRVAGPRCRRPVILGNAGLREGLAATFQVPF